MRKSTKRGLKYTLYSILQILLLASSFYYGYRRGFNNAVEKVLIMLDNLEHQQHSDLNRDPTGRNL